MHLHGTFVHPGPVAEGKGRWIAGGVAGLALAVLAAVAVVSLTGDTEPASFPAAPSFDTSWAAAQKASEPIESLSAPSSPSVHPAARSEVHSIYVVASEDQAAPLRASLSEADAIRVQLGEFPLLDEVVVLSTDEEFAILVGMEQAMAQVIPAQFVPQRVVVDLRK